MEERIARVEFCLTAEDILQFHQQYLRRFGANRLRIPLTALSLFLIPAAMIWDLLRGGMDFSVTVLAVLLAMLVMLFFYVVFPMSIKGQARRTYYASADYVRPVAMDFYPGVMVASYRYTRYTTGYDSICACCETTSHFCFFENRYTMLGHVLPKSSLTSQQVEGLRTEMQKVFGQRSLVR